MEVEDTVTVTTPEGVAVEMVVVGLGSRFTSALVDTSIQALLIIPLLFGAALAPRGGQAVAAVGFLLVVIGVPTAFDCLQDGRTVGRRIAGLRLVTDDGGGVGFWPALARNVVRIVDFLPAFYAVGAAAIVVTPHSQRLGDLAARTLVVRDSARPARRSGLVVPGGDRSEGELADLPPEASAWDLSRVGRDDLAVLRAFAARRASLDPQHRRALAGELAQRIEPVVVGPTRAGDDERYVLEVLTAAQRRR